MIRNFIICCALGLASFALQAQQCRQECLADCAGVPQKEAARCRARCLKLKPCPTIDKPDLRVDRIDFARYVSPNQLKSYEYLDSNNMPYGERVYLVCAFSNQGAALVGNWKVGYYINGNLVYSQSFGNIAAGAKQSPAGWYVLNNAGNNTYTCVLDYENAISEKSKLNNKATIRFTVERHVTLPVTLHPQETSNWCWAASGQMVMHYLGHDVSQCTEANNRFGKDYCCNKSATDHTPVTGCPKPQCAWTGWPEFDKYDFSFKRTSSTALTWNELVHQIADLSKPVAFSWKWTGGGGHMMVVVGTHTVDGQNWVEVDNPWAPCNGNQETITYDVYVQQANDHTHWDDFYDITYVGGPQP